MDPIPLVFSPAVGSHQKYILGSSPRQSSIWVDYTKGGCILRVQCLIKSARIAGDPKVPYSGFQEEIWTGRWNVTGVWKQAINRWWYLASGNSNSEWKMGISACWQNSEGRLLERKVEASFKAIILGLRKIGRSLTVPQYQINLVTLNGKGKVSDFWKWILRERLDPQEQGKSPVTRNGLQGESCTAMRLTRS